MFNPDFSLIKMQVSSNASYRSMSNGSTLLSKGLESLWASCVNYILMSASLGLMCLSSRRSPQSIHHVRSVILGSVGDMMFRPVWHPHHCAEWWTLGTPHPGAIVRGDASNCLLTSSPKNCCISWFFPPQSHWWVSFWDLEFFPSIGHNAFMQHHIHFFWTCTVTHRNCSRTAAWRTKMRKRNFIPNFSWIV